ncbi:hypothetical protein BT63DRAFT_17901 [Microthyrium microscopicum]|uniref:Plus3 domain-containing protein n=1 Tax=Microthyrium microscopicum TaxID=703497 RepID=A0A6A6UTD6_9PEZI|nr:hypothetical protein BT63DRAFT_17901 [Microthyrium microscopicum]
MSGLTLDDELLMLAAGGDESAEEGEASPQDHHHSGHSRSPSRSPSRSLSRSRPRSLSKSRSRTLSRSPPPASASHHPKSPGSPSNSKMPASRSDSRPRKDDSEEEGEASDGAGSPGSLGSGAMDESDSEGSDGDDFTRPIEGETAFEREKRLAEQAERDEERLKSAKLKALLNDRAPRPDISKSTKRKAVDIDDDDFGRRPSRQRAKKDDDDDEYTGRRGNRRRDDVSDSPERNSYVKESKPKRDDGKQPGSLQEYERVRVGRSNFHQICFYPGFEDTFRGCFVRVAAHLDPVTGQNQYRMCQIKGFKTGKPYKIMGANNRAYMTDTMLITSYGPIDKDYPFSACSDSAFTEEEFLRRNQMLDSKSISQSTSISLQSKCKAINEFLERNWTSAQISEKVANQFRLNHLLNNGQSNGMAGAPKLEDRDAGLARRNAENRRLNQEQVRKALTDERRKRQKAGEQAARKQKEEEERKQKAELDDLFGDDDAEEKKSESPKAKPVSKYVVRDYKKGVSEFTRLKTDDEIIASMDLDIDIDIDI